MKYIFVIMFLLQMMAACHSPVNESTQRKTVDTLVIIQRDTIFIQSSPAATTASKMEDKPKLKLLAVDTPKKQKEIVQNPPMPTYKTPANDTIYYYYTNKKISAKVTPWENSKRWTLLYNLLGEETYRQEDVRMSYTVSTSLSFHPNGAVSKMEIHSNPGASRYWGEITITFNTVNEPIQRQSVRMPIDNLSETLKPWEYWDPKTKQWRKQEVME